MIDWRKVFKGAGYIQVPQMLVTSVGGDVTSVYVLGWIFQYIDYRRTVTRRNDEWIEIKDEDIIEAISVTKHAIKKALRLWCDDLGVLKKKKGAGAVRYVSHGDNGEMILEEMIHKAKQGLSWMDFGVDHAEDTGSFTPLPPSGEGHCHPLDGATDDRSIGREATELTPDRSRDDRSIGRETTDLHIYSNRKDRIENDNSIPSSSFKGKENEVHGKNPELSKTNESTVPDYESLEDGSMVFNDSDYMAIELKQITARHYKLGREMIAAAHEADIDEGEFLKSFSSWLVHDWKAENGKQFRLYKDGRGLSKLFSIHAASIKSGWVKGKPSSTLETFAEKYVSWMRENCISTFKGDTKYQGYPETVYQEEVKAIQRLLANSIIGPDELRAAMIVGAHDPDVWSDYPFMWSGMDLNDKDDILRVRSNNLSRALRILKAYDDERVNHYQKLKEEIENGH